MQPKIMIRFIRKDDTESDNRDDIIVIKNVGADQYSLSYTYGPGSKNPTLATLSGDGVFRWMRRTLNLLVNDLDPFDTVQLDFPLMPSVLYNMKDVDDQYHAILDALEFSLDYWPADPSDSSSDSSSDSDSTPASPIIPPPDHLPHDLPPLSPVTSLADTLPYEPYEVPHYSTWDHGRHHHFFDEEDGEVLNLCSPPREL
jgi:hypothetical protein